MISSSPSIPSASPAIRLDRSKQILETPAAAGSSSGAGWSGALDAPPEENALVAEESRAAVEAAAPRAE